MVRAVGPLLGARPLAYLSDCPEPFHVGRVDHDHVHTIEIPFEHRSVTVHIPKERSQNIIWRRRILLDCEENPKSQAAVLRLCAAGINDKDIDRRIEATTRGFIFWINAFGWTLLQNRVLEDGRQVPITAGGGVDVPWILWPVQDEIVYEVVTAIERGTDIAVDKSREMGLTWILVAIILYYWLFRPGTNFIVMSRVQELVDAAGDPASSFWKLDYMLDALPHWMCPSFKRVYMRLINHDANTTIVGKSTTKHQGRGGRVTAVLLDEAATMDNLKDIWVSMGKTTTCRIANSTPYGPGFFKTIVKSKTTRTIQASYIDHPEKGRGRHLAKADEQTARFLRIKKGDQYVETPWLRGKIHEAIDPLEIAQEVMMDHSGSGLVFFPAHIISVCKLKACTNWYAGDICFDEDNGLPLDTAIKNKQVDLFYWNDEALFPRWRLWCFLVEDENGFWRPEQDRTYCIGVDIAHGTTASNSVITVKEVETGRQVGEMATSTDDPAEFARLACMAGLWWGGARGCAFMIWEANGPGGIFGITVRKLLYPWVYFRTDETRSSRPKTDKFGWYSNPGTKQDCLGELMSGVGRGEYEIMSPEAVEEMEDYKFYKGHGDIGPSELEDDTTGARKTHGDRVISSMLAHHGSKRILLCRPPERIALPGSPAFRRKRAKEPVKEGVRRSRRRIKPR